MVTEGFCLPVLEAMAVGVPVIATEKGPTDEFTRPEFAKRIPAKEIVLIGLVDHVPLVACRPCVKTCRIPLLRESITTQIVSGT